MELSRFKYDVFLSFRGEDTRNNFTSHLHRALCDQKIETFIDYDLCSGDDISPSLLQAIEGSQISIIVFSKGYASSRWCLEELMKILQCMNTFGQIVVPVFYEVDPSDVRNQTGCFAEAFVEHEQRFKESLDAWKGALKEAANLSGLDSSLIKPESVLIENIVQVVLKRLNDMSSNDNKDLIGIDSRINEIESLLCIGSKDVRSVGIWGIGGIGKTTLAAAVFDKIFCQFDASYFSCSVREECEQSGGLNRLRQELYSAILRDVNICNSLVGHNFTKKRLGRKKSLLVFDDVTNFRQLESLIGGFDNVGSGSRIIITTRNKQVLKNCRVDQIYEIKELPSDDALKLFCRYAFRQNRPTLEYEKLSHKVVNYLAGIPLALKVLGSSLLDKRKEVWESAMKKLERILDEDIYEVLKISYDGLNDNQRRIFLDIACFLKGKHIDLVKQFLNASGFFTEVEMTGLVDKSLIAISKDNTINMHDLLQAMGRENVRLQSIEDLGQRSRLWHHEDIYHVLTKNLGSKAIQGISFDMSRTEYIDLNPCAFANMQNMRYLEFYCSNDNEKNENKVHVSKGLDSVFNELRYLHWYGCPFKSLQSNVNSEHLVILKMQDSNVEQLWNGVMQLVNLKEIDLTGSEHLISCPDLSGARNLEILDLGQCTSLLEISSSLQYLSKLDSLYLNECKSLRGLPDCFSGLKSLRYLNMCGCSYLKMLPDMSCYIEYFNLSETAVEELSPAIENLSKLVELSLRKCSRLKSLPNNICKLKSLEQLFLSYCSKIDKLPDEIGTLESLKTIDVVETAIREVPSSIVHLNNLEMLSFKRCKIQDTMGLLLPPSLGLCSLKNLNLTDCGITEIPDSLGHLSQLRRLYLGSNNFEIIPANITNLFNLEFLDISYCQRLRFLPGLPSVSINAVNCILLEVLPFLSVPYTSTLDIRFYVSFVNCFKLYQNGLKDIVEDVLQKLESLATLWTKQPYLKDVKRLPGASICFPGSEIPEWFNFRSTGSLIIEELPPCWNNNRFVGFALCAVMQIQHHRIENSWDLYICCECNFKSKDGRCHIVRGQFGYPPYDYHVKPYSVKSDHVYIGSDHLMYPKDTGELCYNNLVTFQFYLLSGQRRIECCNVKSCGVRLMYAQDLGKSNGSFSFGEREDEPQPKRLKSI